MRAHFIALGAEPAIMTPPQFGALMVNAAAKWAKVIKFADIKIN
jgi:hypothetical protein